MKTIILILVLSFSLSLAAQTYLKVADKPEYELYKKWCAKPVQRHVEFNVVIKKQLVNNLYTDSTGFWLAVYPITGSLVKMGTSPIVEPNEQLFSFYALVYVQQRNPSIADFYANWQKIKLDLGIK